MVFRLFVPPGAGEHAFVPKRPDPLGANAALQYSILSSTAGAAAYTSLATRYGHRVPSGHTLSRPALFIRSSAKLGLWGGVLGAAANWWYHTSFTSIVASHDYDDFTPWQLYERTKKLTVDDGCLLGASLGLAASVPTLFMRRFNIPRWTRCFGLAQIGASAGIIGAHGYFQYTGERQHAYALYDRSLKVRAEPLYRLCSDKEMMARFNPLLQLYVRHNALLYTPHLPEETVDVSSSNSANVQEEQSYYLPPFDYADDLKRISVEATYTKMEEHEAEITALLKEAEFILYISAHRQYEYCHLSNVDDEERRQRLEELQLLQITYNKIRSAAEQLQSQLINWRMSLQHKAILEASTSESSSLQAWLPKSTHDFTTHDPALAITELERTQAALDAEIKSFEASIAYPRYPKEKKDRWRMDLEDGRSLLRAADKIVLEFENMQEAARNKSLCNADEASRTTVHQIVAKVDGKNQLDGTTASKPPSGSLEPGQS